MLGCCLNRLITEIFVAVKCSLKKVINRSKLMMTDLLIQGYLKRKM